MILGALRRKDYDLKALLDIWSGQEGRELIKCLQHFVNKSVLDWKSVTREKERVKLLFTVPSYLTTSAKSPYPTYCYTSSLRGR